MILSSCHNFPPIFCDFSCTKRCQSCPALNIIRFLTAFFGTVWVTWSMTCGLLGAARKSSLRWVDRTSSLDAFSLSMWPKSEKEQKSAIYIAKDSSLERLMAVLWSWYCVLDARNLWGWFLHEEAPISRNCPFWQLTSILGDSCRDGHCESKKVREILGKFTHV